MVGKPIARRPVLMLLTKLAPLRDRMMITARKSGKLVDSNCADGARTLSASNCIAVTSAILKTYQTVLFHEV